MKSSSKVAPVDTEPPRCSLRPHRIPRSQERNTKGLEQTASDASVSSLSAEDISDMDSPGPGTPTDRLCTPLGMCGQPSSSSNKTTERQAFTANDMLDKAKRPERTKRGQPDESEHGRMQPPPAKRTKRESEDQELEREGKQELPETRKRKRSAKGQAYFDSLQEEDGEEEVLKKTRAPRRKTSNTQRQSATKRKRKGSGDACKIPESKKRQLEECLFEAVSFLIDSSSTNPAELDAVNGMLSLSHEQDSAATGQEMPQEVGETEVADLVAAAKEQLPQDEKLEAAAPAAAATEQLPPDAKLEPDDPVSAATQQLPRDEDETEVAAVEHAREADKQEVAEEDLQQPSKQPIERRGSGMQSIRKRAAAGRGSLTRGNSLPGASSSNSCSDATGVHSAELVHTVDSTPPEPEPELWRNNWEQSHLARLETIEEEEEAAMYLPDPIPGEQEPM